VGDHRYIYRLLVCLRNYLIGLVGFELTACRRGDRSTVAHRVIQSGWVGFELTAYRRGDRSTVPSRSLVESGWWDLNPRPPGPEPGALPS